MRQNFDTTTYDLRFIVDSSSILTSNVIPYTDTVLILLNHVVKMSSVYIPLICMFVLTLMKNFPLGHDMGSILRKILVGTI